MKHFARNVLLGAGFVLGFGAMAEAANCALPSNAAQIMARAIDAVNAERRIHGLGPLTRSALLDKAAQGHACWMGATENFSHRGNGGSLPKKRIRATGYHTMLTAENIAWGQKSAAEVIDTWMGSDGHRRNILLNVDEVGIGVALMNGRIAWVMDFAAK